MISFNIEKISFKFIRNYWIKYTQYKYPEGTIYPAVNRALCLPNKIMKINSYCAGLYPWLTEKFRVHPVFSIQRDTFPIQ